jgi:hypothetical protein
MPAERYYVVMTSDKPDAGDLRLQMRPKHRAYLQTQTRVRIHAAGPLLAEHGETMDGTFILCSAASRADVETFVSEDPYNKSGLPAGAVIRRLNWTLGGPDESHTAVPAASDPMKSFKETNHG